MNIQTKFGLGEIVTTHQRCKGDQIIPDLIGEVVTIQVSSMAAKTIYFVRVGGQILFYGEDELIGDPDYDQEKGGYTDASDPNWRRKYR